VCAGRSPGTSAAAAKHLLFYKTVVRLRKMGATQYAGDEAAAARAQIKTSARIAIAFLESGAPRFISSSFLPVEDESSFR